MHLALQIDEILIVIMQWARWVDNDPETWRLGLPKGLRVLAALARTCKTVSDPALNELWHSQECISHLLLLSDAVEELIVKEVSRWERGVLPNARGGVSGDSRILRLKREPQPSDWDVVRKYSQRIRIISLSWDGSCHTDASVVHEVDADLCQALLRAQKASPIFSNLTRLNSLTCGLGLPIIRDYPSVFLPSTLSQFSFSCNQLDDHRSMFEHLTSVCRQIMAVEFSTSRHSVISSEDIRTFLASSLLLRSFTCRAQSSNLHPALLLVALALPAIVEVYVNVASPLPPFEQPSVLPSNVRKLSLCMDTIEEFLLIVQNLSLPRLEEVSLIFIGSSQGVEEPLDSLLFFLARSLKLTIITYYSSDVDYGLESSRPRPVIHHSVLRPLLKLSSLQTLSFSVHWVWELDDALLLEVAQAWSGLRSLRLHTNLSWEPTRLTFKGLGYLSQYCPKLQYLCASIDASVLPEDVPTPKQQKPSSFTPEGTLHLDIATGSSYPDHIPPASLADYIKRLFPRLKDFERRETHKVHRMDREEEEKAKVYWTAVALLLNADENHSDDSDEY